MRTRWCILAVALLCANALHAGEQLTIRLIEARNDGETEDEQLADVADFLHGKLPFRAYRQLEAKSIALPADEAVTLAHGLELRCTGAQDELEVVIERPRRITTKVSLHDGKPFVIGPFQVGPGPERLLILLLVR